MAYLTQLEVHEACTVGDCDALEEYIGMGKYDLDCRDPDWQDRAPLHWACLKGFVDCIRLLLENGANGGIRMDMDWTPAHCAAEAGKLNSLRCLHSFGAPINKKDKYGDRPERIAQIYGHTDCVKYIRQVEQERKDKKRKLGLDDDSDEDDDKSAREGNSTEPKPPNRPEKKRPAKS